MGMIVNLIFFVHFDICSETLDITQFGQWILEGRGNELSRCFRTKEVCTKRSISNGRRQAMHILLGYACRSQGLKV